MENFGAFVDIGAEREGMVHVSEMETGYVSRPSDVVKVGQEVEVRVIEINPKKRQIKLTMKPDMTEMMQAAEESAAKKPVLTPMQLAFEAARQQGQPAAPPPSRPRPAVETRRTRRHLRAHDSAAPRDERLAVTHERSRVLMELRFFLRSTRTRPIGSAPPDRL